MTWGIRYCLWFHYNTCRSGLATDHFSIISAGGLDAVLITEHQPELSTHMLATVDDTAWIDKVSLRGEFTFIFYSSQSTWRTRESYIFFSSYYTL